MIPVLDIIWYSFINFDYLAAIEKRAINQNGNRS